MTGLVAGPAHFGPRGQLRAGKPLGPKTSAGHSGGLDRGGDGEPGSAAGLARL